MTRRLLFTLPLPLMLVALSLTGAGAPVEADLILTGGKIITVAQAFSIREAIALKGDRVLAVGSVNDIASLKGSSTRVIDLRGRTLMPGLIDTHLHQIGAGGNLRKVD